MFFKKIYVPIYVIIRELKLRKILQLRMDKNFNLFFGGVNLIFDLYKATFLNGNY